MIALTFPSDSTHSTIAVDQAVKQPLHVTAAAAPRRTVCFDEDSNEYFDNTAQTAEDCHETWYSRDDFHQFRLDNQETIHVSMDDQNDAASPHAEFYTVLQQVFSATRKAKNCRTATEVLSIELTSQLNKLYTSDFAMNMIGMEAQVLFNIKRTLRQQRMGWQDEVYDIQMNYEFADYDMKETMTQEMADASLVYTQSGVWFAQLLAQAQQHY
uniref:Uncharacterized protein n=1 Tax=Entomoneis paludosa TaxID=265537 RepID=A0A7S2Y368_9STRA|mmetsp:Transcript_13574/g.28066  ORF Transcript_13574/g.28066 Transcript_13574/m.28066 type:complete len:213 (+) Transcript_13574:60-698(+)